MLDLLKLLFHAMRHSFRSISSPSADKRTRNLERIVLASTAVGAALFVAAVVHIVRFDFAGKLWVYLIIGSAAFWGLAACIGLSLESSAERDA